MKKLFLTAMTIAAIASCSKNTNPVSEDALMSEIKLTSGVEANTKDAYRGDVVVNGLHFLRQDSPTALGELPLNITVATPIVANR